jgi:hypothetical protein
MAHYDFLAGLASTVESRLAAASPGERLMRRHEALPAADQAPFTLGLRPLLDSLRDDGLGEFQLSDYSGNCGTST